MTLKSAFLSSLAGALLIGVGMAPAMAQHTDTPRIDQNQQEISALIRQGIASGRITREEAQPLLKREHELRMRESRIKTDGYATPHERQRLRQDLDALHAQVERALNNRQAALPERYDGRLARIDGLQRRIHARIDRGVQSGRLTPYEAKVLYRQERDIQRREAGYKSDGVVSRWEREELRHSLAALEEHVDYLMRDGRRYEGRHAYSS